MPSASRNPISRNSSAICSRVSASSVTTPCPSDSTPITQLSGRFSVAVAPATPPLSSRPWAPGPEAGSVARPPIDEVVPAFGARPRMVGNLVGRQACARADRLRRVIERAGDVVVGNDELARRMQRGKRRVLLDGELIEREMLARLDSGAFELAGPY